MISEERAPGYEQIARCAWHGICCSCRLGGVFPSSLIIARSERCTVYGDLVFTRLPS